MLMVEMGTVDLAPDERIHGFAWMLLNACDDLIAEIEAYRPLGVDESVRVEYMTTLESRRQVHEFLLSVTRGACELGHIQRSLPQITQQLCSILPRLEHVATMSQVSFQHADVSSSAAPRIPFRWKGTQSATIEVKEPWEKNLQIWIVLVAFVFLLGHALGWF